MNKQNNSNIISSLAWKFLERGGVTGVQFVVQIVLARLLAPEAFGTIAIVTVFISLANIFVQNGFNMALVQKKDADEKDFSSVFFLSLAISIILYIIIYFTSPMISIYYKDPELAIVLRVLSVTLFIGAFNSIQNAYLARNMMFKKLFYSSMGAILISGTAGVMAAYLELGIWALVIQQVLNQLIVSIIMWFTVKWRPVMVFSLSRVKGLFSFGWKIFTTSILYTLYNDLRTLIIGGFHDYSMLGYYNRGESFPQLVVNNIDGSIQSVMFPAFSMNQDNKEELKNMIRRAIVTSSFFIFPAMVGLGVVAEPVVIILLTDKWLPAVPFLQMFCFSYALKPMQGINLQIINAMGRSDISLKIFFYKRGFELIMLLISIPFGIYAIAFSTVISTGFSTIVNIIPNNKLLDYSLGEQIKDFLPSLILSLFMGVIIFIIGYLKINMYLLVPIQVIVGVVVYLELAYLFKLDSLNYIINTICNIRDKK